MSILDDLSRRGHFPKEFPPPFTTAGFADFALNAGPSVMKSLVPMKPTKCLRHNVARSGGMWRQLSVPHPGSHYMLSTLIDGAWRKSLSPLLTKAKLAASVPVRSAVGRAFVPRVGSGTEDSRALSRSGGRYLLVTDIQNFYPSVYTHSIPWALHGKQAAKRNRSKALLGNALDSALRQGQDGQTVGVPIGPDSSMVIAECLLAAVEARLLQRLPQLQGYRFWDDIELTFGTRGDAEEALGVLQEVLAEFELSLNPRKTHVVKLPAAIDAEGLHEMRTWQFRSTPAGQRRDIHGYFDHVNRLVANDRGGNTAAFALGRLRNENFLTTSWELVEANALQLLVSEPSCALHVAPLLSAAAAVGYVISKASLSAATERLASRHSSLGHGSEIAWGVWMCIEHQVPLSPATTDSVSRMSDDVVALLTLHARSLLLTPTSLNTSNWEQFMVADELIGPHWLLSYEARIKGWLPSLGIRNHIRGDPFFSALQSAKVSFYDNKVTRSSILPSTAGSGGPYGL